MSLAQLFRKEDGRSKLCSQVESLSYLPNLNINLNLKSKSKLMLKTEKAKWRKLKRATILNRQYNDLILHHGLRFHMNVRLLFVFILHAACIEFGISQRNVHHS